MEYSIYIIVITNIQGVVEACRHTVLAEQDTEHLVVALLQHIALAVVDQVVYMAAAKRQVLVAVIGYRLREPENLLGHRILGEQQLSSFGIHTGLRHGHTYQERWRH